ncbi:protein kinase-like domain [Stemphylium lycopersici]|nr:protein kinase-like domain [Stemphylium lycopersici]
MPATAISTPASPFRPIRPVNARQPRQCKQQASPGKAGLAKAKETRPSGSTETAEAEDAGRKSTASSSRPRADQFCVYNTGTTRSAQDRVAAFILEYKAPHKLPLGYIYEGLGEMQLDEVVQCRDDETLRDRSRRLVAAVITQAFSYMVRIGVEYGCVCTGEAYIFLWVGDDPRTVHYFLSVPKGDVGETTGWTAGSEGANRLHLTAVGQMLAFTLEALKTPPRLQRWRTKAAAQLHSWEVVCRQAEQRHEASDDEPESEPDPDTPSRQQSLSQRFSRTQKTGASSSSGRKRERRRGQGAEDGQYCTQECLRGLAEGGIADFVHMMFLSYGGHSIGQHLTAENKASVSEQVVEVPKLDASLSTVWHLHELRQEFSIRIYPMFEFITMRSLEAES